MTQDINIIFSRAMLSNMHRQIRERFPHIKPMKDAWVWNGGFSGRKNWEFHGPDGFFVHVGSADNAYHARYKGWLAYMEADEIGRAHV